MDSQDLVGSFAHRSETDSFIFCDVKPFSKDTDGYTRFTAIYIKEKHLLVQRYDLVKMHYRSPAYGKAKPAVVAMLAWHGDGFDRRAFVWLMRGNKLLTSSPSHIVQVSGSSNTDETKATIESLLNSCGADCNPMLVKPADLDCSSAPKAKPRPKPVRRQPKRLCKQRQQPEAISPPVTRSRVRRRPSRSPSPGPELLPTKALKVGAELDKENQVADAAPPAPPLVSRSLTFAAAPSTPLVTRGPVESKLLFNWFDCLMSSTLAQALQPFPSCFLR